MNSSPISESLFRQGWILITNKSKSKLQKNWLRNSPGSKGAPDAPISKGVRPNRNPHSNMYHHQGWTSRFLPKSYKGDNELRTPKSATTIITTLQPVVEQTRITQKDCRDLLIPLVRQNPTSPIDYRSDINWSITDLIYQPESKINTNYRLNLRNLIYR